MISIRPFIRTLLLAGIFAAPPLAAQLQIRNSALPIGYVSNAYPATPLYAQGGTAPYSFTLIAGSLPAGFVFASPSGVLSGTPTGAPTTVNLTIQVSDGVGATASRILALAVNFPPAPPNWTVKGLYGGNITRIVASPNYPLDSTLFAAGTQGEIFRSLDRGLNWGRVLPDPNHAGGTGVSGLVLSPIFNSGGTTAAQKTLFVSSVEMGVFTSTDGGLTFSSANSGLPCNGDPACMFGQPSIMSLAISPAFSTDGTLWAIAKIGFALDFVIFRTQNGGATWSRLSSIPYCSGYDIQRIYVSPGYPADNTLFAHVCNVLHRSLNGGATWSPLFSDPNTSSNGFENLVISPDYATDQTFVVENRFFDFFRSSDGGASFTKATMAGAKLSVTRRAGRTPAWYFVRMVLFAGPAAPPYQLARSDDGMRTQVPIFGDGYPAPVDYNEVGAISGAAAASGAEPDLYYGVSLGLYGSFDNGESFSNRDRGLTAYLNSSVSGSGNALVGCAFGAWFKSEDGGVSWVRQPLPGSGTTCTLTAVSPDYLADRTLFVNDRFNGLYRSGDNGQSFSLVFSSTEVRTFAFVPGFSGGNGTVYIGTNTGLNRSTDGGRSFTPVTLSADCGNSIILGLAVSPAYASDTTIFAATYVTGGVGGLCRSSDGGVSWLSLKNNTNRIYGPLDLSPVYNNNGANGTAQKTLVLFNQLSDQLLRSTDGGNSWSPGTFPGFVRGEPRMSPNFATDRTVLFFSGGGSYASGQRFGIFRSSDDGATFAALGATDGLKARNTSGLYLLPAFNGNNLSSSPAVAASFGSGIWRSDDGARSFSAVTAFSTLSSSINGMSRAATGTIYAATPNAGVFRSTDGGALFTGLASGLPVNANVNAVIAAAAAPANPVAGVRNQGLWRLSGSTWTQLAAQATGNFVSFHDDGVNLYAARADGVSLRSTDGGALWMPQDAAQISLVNLDYNAQTTPTFLSDPATKLQGPRPNAVNAVTASLWAVSQSAGPRYSINSGTSWTATPGTNDYALPGGQTWSIVRALGVNATSGSREVVAGSTTGLFRSNDGGATWRNVSGTGSGLEATSKNFSTAISTVTSAGNTDLLVGAIGTTNGGVYLSGDGGEHWTQVNAGFDPANLSISSLIKTSCAGCPVQYYSGSYGGGMYTRTISVVAPPTFPFANYSCYGTTTCSCITGGGNGPEQGGQAFKLCGSNFQPNAIVEFDGVPATGCTATANIITCTGTPPHAPGFAKIRVRNPDTRVGYLPAQYTYTTGVSRASLLRVTKAGANAALTWSCASCTSSPALVYRAQNVSFSAFLEQYNGGTGGTFTNLGAVSSAQSYFWSVE